MFRCQGNGDTSDFVQNYPFDIYGAVAGSALTWFLKSPTEGRYRFLLFLTEVVKIQKYKDDLASPIEAWKYLDSLKNQILHS